MQYRKDTRDFIREKREASGLSIQKFAHKAGIDPATLCNIENKKQGMSKKTLVQIILGFDMKLSEFFKQLEDKNYDY